MVPLVGAIIFKKLIKNCSLFREWKPVYLISVVVEKNQASLDTRRK
jgi:hypothetical protein